MKTKFLLFLALALATPGRAALVYPAAPTGGETMVYKNAHDLLQSDPGFLGGYHAEELTLSPPCREYYIGLTNVAAGRLLSAAESHGAWQYMFLHGTDAAGAAGLVADEKAGGTLKFNDLYQTDGTQEMVMVLRMAEQLPQVKRSDYEVRRLDDPSILFMAVWLHGKTDDLIIPLGLTFGRWEAGRPYTEKQMLKLLRPEAKKKLAEPPELLD